MKNTEKVLYYCERKWQTREDAFNGNKSAVHWDLVMIQRPEYGGGEIWFDDVLIRKDGLFVIDELKCLNPENLK